MSRIFRFKSTFYSLGQPERKKSRVDSAKDVASGSGFIVTRMQAKVIQSFDSSAPSPFDTLANELLENIFTFLDRTSLKNSLLVDGRWNTIISKSPKTMNLLPLTIRPSRPIKSKDLNRNYQGIIFKHLNKNLIKSEIKSLTRLGQQVKSVKFESCHPRVKIFESLQLFPIVESIEFENMYIKRKSDVQLNPMQLEHLKSIKTDNFSNVRNPELIMKSP
jgi:hypothetical protein